MIPGLQGQCMYEDYYLGHPAEIIWSDSQVLLVWMDDDVTWVSRPLKIVLVGAGASSGYRQSGRHLRYVTELPQPFC